MCRGEGEYFLRGATKKVYSIKRGKNYYVIAKGG